MDRRYCAIVAIAMVTAVWVRTVKSLTGYKGDALSYNLTLGSLLNETELDLTKGIRDKLEMPDWINANLTVERFGLIPLRLVRQRFMGVSPRAVTSSRGTSVKAKKYENKDVFFYTDRDGNGSVACELKRYVKSGNLFCETYALISVGQYSCYIGPGAEKADCTPRVYRKRDCYRNVPVLNGLYNRAIAENVTSQSVPLEDGAVPAAGDYTLPRPGYKTVEVVFVLDAKFMEVFYDRHPGAPKRAQREVTVYMSLLANEINVFFDSFRKMTKGKFVLFVYPVAVLFPKFEEDFRWSSYNNDGQVLTATNKMNFVLWKFVEKVLKIRPVDHVMAFTGYSLHREDGPLLGFAYSSTVCTQVTWKYSVIEFREVDASASAAHEIGHALSAEHDEEVGCDPSSNVMTGQTYAPTADTRDKYFRFSRCSRRDIWAHLNKFPDCTSENGFTNKQFEEAFCAGFLGNQEDSLDIQCQRRTGYAGSTACNVVRDDSGCYRYGSVRCRGREGRCNPRLGYVWNGTPCGPDMMCFKGRCTNRFDICPSSATVAAPCQCCGLTDDTERRRCCGRGLLQHGQDCYCCGELRNVQPHAVVD